MHKPFFIVEIDKEVVHPVGQTLRKGVEIYEFEPATDRILDFRKRTA